MSTLPECIKCGNYIHSGFVVCDTCNDELPTIRTELTQLRAENAALKAERQWIPVSERLPDNHDDILLWDYGELSVGWYSEKRERFMSYKESGPTNYITHWMPLPPAPDNK